MIAWKRWISVVAVLSVAAYVGGCASTSETASQDTLTAHVGKYPPAPAGIVTPRVGVPPFSVQTAGGFSKGGDLNDLAADQMCTLLDQTERFKVIERTQLQKLLNEQNMEGIVRPGEMAKSGQVRGVDYLLLGKVTNLRVKLDKTQKGFGLAQIGGIVNLGGLDIKSKETKLTTECGVDIRLVNPTTGETWVSNFSEYKRVDTAGAMGVTVLGANADADATIQVSEDDKGKILRLALDDSLRKCLPKIDRMLQQSAPSGDAAPANNATPANAAAAPASGEKHFCPSCGKPVLAGVKFCPSCGKSQP